MPVIDLDSPRPEVAPRAARPRRLVLVVAGLMLAALAGEPAVPAAPDSPQVQPIILCHVEPGIDAPAYLVILDSESGEVAEDVVCPS
ncbi:hypothetical protein Q0Z83_013420 [Actinoplanes sichuanensis]|uniref:Uncharacterized protein n=1 Tax=Actinoplanes sichuanensis TaxID=512349 RepID=A0ABW4A520_9ACTN|nr:hypothetical protein [Actinoplanes sichuanensis]BEL03151.1 hypothetical protein Q0Z83_013420 [Actinoplanes sichuanensis]